jgi:hypothetical protein
MWHTGHPAPEQCEGCTWVTSQVRELSYIHSRDVTYATFCKGPYEESARYRDFMGWEMPWYSAQGSLDTLLVGRRVGMMHIVCYLRQGSKVFETYWTTIRGVEAMDNSYRLLDLTVYGRQEKWEDSPPSWPQQHSLQEWRSQSLYNKPEDFVFPSERLRGSKPLDLASVLKKKIQPAFRRIGIMGVGWHTFRHSVGTMLAEMGEHQLTIRDYLRHSNLHVTNKYLQATSKTKRLAQDKLVDAILPTGILPKTNLIQ